MSDAESIVVLKARRLARDLGIRGTPLPGSQPLPDTLTAAQAKAFVRKFSRTELANSLRTLVELRDYAYKDSVRKDAAAQLVQFACDDDDTTVGVDTKALGISTEELSEFLRSRRQVSVVK